MSIIESFLLAMEALLANKVRSALTMLGVIIGVLSVILLVALGTGARLYIEDQFAGLGANLLIIVPGKSGTGPGPFGTTGHELTYEDSKALERLGYMLNGVSPIQMGSAKIKYRGRNINGNIIGTNKAFADIRNIRVEIGGYLTESDITARRRVAVIGQHVWSELFGGENPLGQTIRLNDTSYRVVGILEKQGQSLGFNMDDITLVPVTAAQDLFGKTALVEIITSVVNADSIDNTMEQIKKIIRRRHSNEDDITVQSQAAMLGTLNTILNMMTFLLAGIAAISLVVGGIGIMNILLVSVRERTREIGVRIAVGARKRDILTQFLIESVVISSTGGIIGILMGGGMALALKLATDFPAQVTFWSVSLAFGFSFFVGVFFGVYPARKASRLDPIDALRYE